MPALTVHEQYPGAGSQVHKETRHGQSGVPIGGWRAAGYEAMNIIRKGQIRWLPQADIVGQVRFIEWTFGIGA